MTNRVQFREDQGVLSFVEELGLNPNEVARRAFAREVRRLRAEERADRLAEAGIDLPRSGTELVREDRER